MSPIYVKRNKFDIRIEYIDGAIKGYLMLDDGEVQVLLTDSELDMAKQSFTNPEPLNGTGE